MAGFPNLDGLAYVFTVPFGICIGLMFALPVAIFGGATWWVCLPIFLGLCLGIFIGTKLEG